MPTKTLNGLPEHLQWLPGMDENHVFPEERHMIKEMRAIFGEDIDDWSDKLILYFLFARRCEPRQSEVLIASYLKTLKELGWLHRRPTIDNAPMLKSGAILFDRMAVDKQDRILVFLNMKLVQPTMYTKEENLLNLIYETNLIADTMPVRLLRNGCTQVLEMEGFGLRNIDASHSGIELLKAMQGVFPRRVRQFHVLNGGWVLKIMMGLARRVLPSKLLERINVVANPLQLKEVIDQTWVPTRYGGQCKLNLDAMVEDLREYDRQFNHCRRQT